MSLPSNIFGVDRSIVLFPGVEVNGRGQISFTFMSASQPNSVWLGAWDMGLQRTDISTSFWVPDWGSLGTKIGAGDYAGTTLFKNISGFGPNYTSSCFLNSTSWGENRDFTVYHFGNRSGENGWLATGDRIRVDGPLDPPFNLNAADKPDPIDAPFPFLTVKWDNDAELWRVIFLI